MTSTDKLFQTAQLLGKKLTKSNIIGYGAILDLKSYKGFRIKLYSLALAIRIIAKAESSVGLSFNSAEAGFKVPLSIIDYPTRVFVGSHDNAEDVTKFLNKVRPLIDEFALIHTESIAIGLSEVSAEVHFERDIIATIDSLLKIIEINDVIQKDEETNDLPEHLKDLYPLFQKYAVSDDQERDELIESLTKKEIKVLVNKVENKIDDINVFLDSFQGRPFTENAQMLMSLTELVLELKNASQ